jgi:ABC-2 type transport system permease protein
MFPIANMPLVFQWFTLLNPLRYFIEIVRGLFMKEVGLVFLLPRLLVLISLGLTFMVIAGARFKKRLT